MKMVYIRDIFWFWIVCVCVGAMVKFGVIKKFWSNRPVTPENHLDWSCLPAGVSPAAIPEYYGCVEIAGQKVAAFRRSALVNGVYYSLSSTSFDGLNQMHLKIIQEAGQ